MNDDRVKRCSICGNWSYLTDADILQLLLGEQHMCKMCKGRGAKNRVA